MSFFVELWNSVFTPGTSPQLIIATNLSFLALIITLIWLIVQTNGNIHFIILLSIATILWITVIWFINELKSVKLMTNEELGTEETKNKDVNTETQAKKASGVSKSSTKKISSRKV
ncbi:hypothetical protein TPHA_0G02320 [Tetrapisispora phaffii CBS 4417]|uniref:SMK killer toxin resistance protein n=1 Tax=Tetrapisispora phaffii (strain ATCC 24235 / CBS 4417 / NBRC 1672 / NRRL Y-8282 / UCD 70-5) TaxID=1071381 RepID=G8BVZ0_TETPH|nr:hypothetical protein TPHA_0G02320 [Tetrapisispora phaffii CBS 4417]CCE64068.1 hypothetical protein TPHA_0G02320 [Tetrapisispora phaffii CBS 4417]